MKEGIVGCIPVIPCWCPQAPQLLLEMINGVVLGELPRDSGIDPLGPSLLVWLGFHLAISRTIVLLLLHLLP